MKHILILAAIAALAGCGDPGSTLPPKFNAALPLELKDCKVFKVTDGIQSLYITRCPDSTSTTNPNKGGSSVTTENSHTPSTSNSIADTAAVTAAQAEIDRAKAQMVEVQTRIKTAEDALKGQR